VRSPPARRDGGVVAVAEHAVIRSVLMRMPPQIGAQPVRRGGGSAATTRRKTC